MTEAVESIHCLTEPPEHLVFVMDRNAIIQCVNQCGTTPFGCEPREMIGQPLKNFLSAPSHQDFEAKLQALFEPGDMHSLAANITVQDGRRELETKLIPFWGHDGRIVSILGISREAGALQGKSDRTEKTKHDWRMAVDSMRHLMAIVDDRYRITSVNQALAEKLGLTPGQALQSPCFEKLHSTGEPPPCCPLQREKYNGGKHLQERSDTLFGGQYLFSVSPLKDRLGTVTGCIYVARSQTESERHRQECDQRRQSMRALMQKAERLIFVQDAQARYLFFTATPEQGEAPVDVIGRSPEDLFEPAVASRMVERVRQVAREGKELMELTSISAGEQVLLFVDQLAPLRDAGGSITAVATLSKRMTERNRGREELSPSSKTSRELTQRETGILRLIASGLTSAQIGERLGISRKTVETHRTRIMQKLDIHKTSALVRYAAKAGLL